VPGEQVERNLYGLRETLIAAEFTKNCQRLLEDANLAPELLRFQMRLAKDLECLKGLGLYPTLGTPNPRCGSAR